MRADVIAIGTEINYKGRRAVVAYAWKTLAERTKSFVEPVGVELTRTDDNGEEQRTRIVWPVVTQNQRWLLRNLRWPEANPRPITAAQRLAIVANLLSVDLTNIEIDAWGG